MIIRNLHYIRPIPIREREKESAPHIDHMNKKSKGRDSKNGYSLCQYWRRKITKTIQDNNRNTKIKRKTSFHGTFLSGTPKTNICTKKTTKRAIVAITMCTSGSSRQRLKNGKNKPEKNQEKPSYKKSKEKTITITPNIKNTKRRR